MSFIYIKYIAPGIKARKADYKKEREKEQLEKEKKIFFEIFGFSLDDYVLSFQEQRNHVLKTIGSLEMKAKEYEESFSRFSSFVSSINKITTRDIMYHVSKQRFLVLENLNWGLGVRNLEYLDIFCECLVRQKKDLAAEARKVAIYFKFNV